MLSLTLMTSARRHIGLPVVGIPDSQFELGVLSYDPDVPIFRQAYLFEQRMRNLAPNEESVLSGLPIADISMTGTPLFGAALGVAATPNGGSALALGTYAATNPDIASPEPLAAIAVGIVNAINAANTPYTAALSAHNAQQGVAAGFATFTIQALQPNAFEVALEPTLLGAYVTQQGSLPALAASFNQGALTIYGLLPILDYLEARIASSADFAAYEQADVVKFAPDELEKRIRQYSAYRRQLSKFFGISLNPLGNPNSASSGRGAVV